jgi:hypothetical protein
MRDDFLRVFDLKGRWKRKNRSDLGEPTSVGTEFWAFELRLNLFKNRKDCTALAHLRVYFTSQSP